MADRIDVISFRSKHHEFLRSYHGDICVVLSRSEETLILFAVMLYGKRIIDVHTKNTVIRKKGGEGADILMDKVEMKVEQTPRHLKRILRMMKKLEDLETISRKIGSKISRSRRRSHPLLSSDRFSEEESSSVALPGEGELCVRSLFSHGHLLYGVSIVEPHLMDTEPKMWPSMIIIANTLLFPKCICTHLCMIKTLHENLATLKFFNAEGTCISIINPIIA